MVDLLEDALETEQIAEVEFITSESETHWKNEGNMLIFIQKFGF